MCQDVTKLCNDFPSLIFFWLDKFHRAGQVNNMKLIVSDPATSCTKMYEVDDEKKLMPFYDKRIGAEVPGDSIDPAFEGYILKITGGNDKQGFPMMQGVLVNHRVRLLFKKGMPCYRERRAGAMKRKSVRGCIVAPDVSVLSMVVVQRGSKDIEGLTDQVRPARLGPKRATKIRKLFHLSKDEDVRPYVVRRVIKEGKRSKAPKIQRLITPARLRRKRVALREGKERRARSVAAAKEYKEVLRNYITQKNTERSDEIKNLKEARQQRRERHMAASARRRATRTTAQ
eukprot:Blabericola_migrator_1__1227@NODE_1315_length_4835_cov_207_490982_g885_i0_p4_GENE_NODE_1315_length_4835_cov_207_490982_g885_i0NODE_1315_length_4835_cov_207_490982_g885_i0_p4_ORF_typecomplete_len286_score58_12Ribosomal_S6e/PF01092_19/1_9e49Ribosomal_S6e/PF01092_19/2_2e03_NODE_1315_length_4835_cov_207_490982_g885_i027563613